MEVADDAGHAKTIINTEAAEDKKKKKKKKKHRKKKGTATDDETSASESEAKKERKHRKKKSSTSENEASALESDIDEKKIKHKKKHTKKTEINEGSESETEDGKRRHKHKKKQSKQSSSQSARSDSESGPVIEKRAARRGGTGGMEPEEWSKEDLMEKLGRFGSYEIELDTGSGSLKVEGKRMLGEEIKVTLELLRRHTEIQLVTFRKCFMTDETLELLADGLRGLRHVKKLNLSQNALTRESTKLIISIFADRDRKLQSLDLRENLVNEEDMRMLYYAFTTIHHLNGVNLISLKQDSENRTYELKEKGMTINEIAVMCCAIKRYTYLEALEIQRNLVSSECLLMLADTLLNLRNIKRIDMSYNTLTNNGEEMAGIKAMMEMLRINRSILYITLDGCKVPEKIAENIERSLMVNRCIANSIRGKVEYTLLLFTNYFFGCTLLIKCFLLRGECGWVGM